MKIIEPSYDILPQNKTNEDINQIIELAGRTAYKSEDKITEDSAVKFVEGLKKSKHYSVLEHGSIYLYCGNKKDFSNLYNRYVNNPYSQVTWYRGPRNIDELFITTNLRVIVENSWWEDVEKYGCAITKYHPKRITVKFTTDRTISHQLVRNRVFSVTQESQRFCNYANGKFEDGIVFIKPSTIEKDSGDYDLFVSWMTYSENNYKSLIEKGYKPEVARKVLPGATKTELVMTGFQSDWNKLYKERVLGTTGRPDPDMIALLDPLYKEHKELFIQG